MPRAGLTRLKKITWAHVPSSATLPNGHGVIAGSSYHVRHPAAARAFWSARRLAFLSFVIGVIAAAAIVSTYRVFSETYDEPAHIGAGMQWLARGRFTYEAQHPPLARVMAAVGPYIAGERSAGEANQYDEGSRILGSGGHHRRILALARLGELPFFLLLCLGVWAWGRRLFGETGAALSVLFVATNPNVLAHAGLATTDIASAAMVVVSLYAYARWVERVRLRDAVALGVALGVSAVTRFSAIAFLGATIVCAEVWRAWTRRGTSRETVRWASVARHAALAFLAAAATIWATYRFSFGPVDSASHFPVPAPEFFLGLEEFLGHGISGRLFGHAGSGNATFLLGRTSDTGWWYYFPVALAVKTPLPLLVLAIVGVAATARRVRREAQGRAFEVAVPLIGALVVLAIASRVRVDLGVRLVLPIYPLFALLAAAGVLELWARVDQRTVRGLARGIAVVLVASTMVIPIAAYPDYLAYFNPLAGANPDHVLVDSNLDWGQDLFRLKKAVDSIGIDTLHLGYFGSADPGAIGLSNVRLLHAYTPTAGWVAVSRTFLAGEGVGAAVAWLRAYRPVEPIGHSMLLYHIER